MTAGMAVGDLIQKSRLTTLAPSTIDAVQRCMVDWAGCALAGSAHDLLDRLPQLQPLYGRMQAEGGSTVVGRGRRASAMEAAIINATAAHVLVYDDVSTALTGTRVLSSSRASSQLVSSGRVQAPPFWRPSRQATRWHGHWALW